MFRSENAGLFKRKWYVQGLEMKHKTVTRG